MYNRKGYYKTGRGQQKRSGRIKAILLNVIGVIIALAIFLGLGPEKYLVGAGLIAPFVFVFIGRTSNGKIKIDFLKENDLSISWGIIVILFFMFIRYIMHLNILEYHGIWLPSILMASLLFFSGLIPTEGHKFNLIMDDSKITLSIIALFYGLIATIAMNQVYDTSTPYVYHVTVHDKFSRSGYKSGTSYYFTVSPWDKRKTNEDVEVGKKLYDHTNIKEEVNIYKLGGYLGIPWFVVQN